MTIKANLSYGYGITELYYITGESAQHYFLAKKCRQKHGGFSCKLMPSP